jgi:hypothetical protein
MKSRHPRWLLRNPAQRCEEADSPQKPPRQFEPCVRRQLFLAELNVKIALGPPLENAF